MRFVDSHLHLDGEDAGDTVKSAVSAGIVLLACGVDEESSIGLLDLARRFPEAVKPFVGVHPSEAEKAGGLEWLRTTATRASGVGEIGLDPSYSSIGEGSAQMSVFRRQLEVAADAGKPVQVHSRMAEMKCLELLAASGVSRVLMHWLESEEALPRAMDNGYFVSFGPALLYSKKLQRMALRTDPSLMLLESDSPVAYAPLGGVRGPMLIPSVAFKVAELRGEPFAETSARCAENSLRFLGGKG